MPDLLDHLTARRSVPAPNLQPPGPDEQTLRDMLTIAARVPDHGKLAPWRFIVFAGDARVAVGAALADLVARRDGVSDPERLRQEATRFTRAPLVVAVISRTAHHPKIPEWEQLMSAGAAAMNLVHAAYAHGFAAQWLTEWVAYDSDAMALLGCRPGERIAGLVHIGTPDIRPADRDRPVLDAVVSYCGAETD